MKRVLLYAAGVLFLAVTAAYIFGQHHSSVFVGAKKRSVVKVSYTTSNEVPSGEEFRRLVVSGPFKIVLSVGDKFSYQLFVPDHIRDDIEVELENGVLRVGPRSGSFHWDVRDSEELRLDVTVRTLEELELMGACQLKSTGTLSGERLDVSLSGASRAEFPVQLSRLDVDLSGASSLIVHGTSGQMEAEFTGASKLRAIDLSVENADITASGASNVEIQATKQIRVQASGASNVRYLGNPEVVDINTSGASHVRRASEGG